MLDSKEIARQQAAEAVSRRVMNTKHISVKVDADLWSAFKLATAGQDRSASQELRDYMRKYVKQNGQLPLNLAVKLNGDSES